MLFLFRSLPDGKARSPSAICVIAMQEAVTSQGESIRSQLAVFLHDKHPGTFDPLGKPREMTEPDSLGG
jgi:hypothetical protein